MLHLVLMTAALCLALAPAAAAQSSIETHDNLRLAGERRGSTLHIRLYAGVGTWHPEGDTGPALTVQAFGEEGHGLEIPGPLVRVPAGTTIEASIRNALDVPLELHGFASRPVKSDEPVVIAPSETRRLTFAAGSPGTFHYWATTTNARTLNQRFHVDSQLSGAFIVDEPGAPGDRIFLTTMWAEKSTFGDGALKPSARVNFLINGRAWPHTSRLTYDVGETVRWRVINLSDQPHPMHLHGFYFAVHATGNGLTELATPPPGRRGVTELLRPGGTAQLSWIPDRPGNWLFHCHIVEHITPYLSVAGSTDVTTDHSHHTGGMGGMVIGITVRSRDGVVAATANPARAFTLTMKTVPERFGRESGFGFALDRAREAITPGPTLVLTRGEATQITLVNELPDATAIHWHGIELESYFDGVPGFSGSAGSITPSIPPGGQFDVRFTPPRSGTFIYHTHSHDTRTLQKGLYGALIVTEPGRRYDAETDHVWILGVNGSERGGAGEKDEALLNGALPPTISLKAGVPNRIRLINITAARTGLTFFVMTATDVASWKMLAKDGADLPASQQLIGPARQQVSVGETYDFELVPTEEIRSIEVRRGGAGETLIRAPIVWR